MIVHIISKLDELVNSDVSLLRGIVSALNKEGSIPVSTEVSDALELGGRVLEVDIDSGSTLDKLAHLSKENAADNGIVRIIKEDAEDDDNAVVVLLEPDRLVGTVVNLDELTVATASGCAVEHRVEDAGEHVTGETRSLGGEKVGFLRVELLDDDLDGEVVATLRRSQKRPVHLLDVVHSTVGGELLPAGEGNADDDGGSVLGGVEIPHDLVEISHSDVKELGVLTIKKIRGVINFDFLLCFGL